MSVLEADLPPNLSEDAALDVDPDLDGSPQILIYAEELRPDTAQSLPCVVAPSEGTPSEAVSEAEPEEDSQGNDEESGTEERTISKRKYPYAAMFFIMTAVVGQR